ncbi:MAG TPA: class I SAM-dependent methyltransferase [Gaiellaceae bacterium]
MTAANPRIDSAPQIAVERVDTCAVCGADSFSWAADGFDYELRTCRNHWTFVRCSECGHLWLNPRPAVAELATIYPATYYAYTYRDSVNPVALRAKDFLDQRKLSKIIGALPQMPQSFLDIGCGDGRFLKLMAGRGVARTACYGLELDENAVRPLAAAGYSVYCERVEDTTSIPDGSIALATMFHVIEHVDDPGAVLARLAPWLSPSGVLALETPNIDSLDRRLFSNGYWGGYHIPRHWNLFSRGTITRLLERCGFEVMDIEFKTGHSFWMYSIHHRILYGRPSLPRVAALFDPLRSVVPLAAFTTFDLARARLGARTSSMLVLAKRRGM